jgi:hypothetical protein
MTLILCWPGFIAKSALNVNTKKLKTQYLSTN